MSSEHRGRPERGSVSGRCFLRRGVQGWHTHDVALIATTGAAANDEVAKVRAANRSQESQPSKRFTMQDGWQNGVHRRHYFGRWRMLALAVPVSADILAASDFSIEVRSAFPPTAAWERICETLHVPRESVMRRLS